MVFHMGQGPAARHGKPNITITGAVLAGGRGRRMGGVDKGLLDYHGRPLVAYVADVVRPQVDDLLIIANRNIDRYREFADAVFPDLDQECLGPLAGMASALAHASSEWVLCVPCDTPYLPDNLVARLYRQVLRAGADIAVACDGHRLHPAVCLLHRSCLPSLRVHLQERLLQVTTWLEQCPHTIVDYSDCPQRFINMNTPADMRAPRPLPSDTSSC